MLRRIREAGLLTWGFAAQLVMVVVFGAVVGTLVGDAFKGCIR